MARTYRKTDAASGKLRKAMGILEANLHGSPEAVWKAVGAVQALVEFALIDLDGLTNYEDSPEYAEGAGKVAAWSQPELPLEG